MPPPQIDTAAFAAARGRLVQAADRLRTAEVRLAGARAKHAQLVASGAPSARIQAAQAQVDKLLDGHAKLGRSHEDLLRGLRDLADRAVGTSDPAAFVTTLDGGSPVCLLPVRLETRFFANGTELRIRIYPDQVHLDAHEPELTDAEITAGRRYWQARWQADENRRTAAWTEIANTLDPRRARWVVERLTPTNPDEEPRPGSAPVFPEPARKGEAWARAVHATALPNRWVAVGYRDGAELFRRWGRTVPDVLPTTPTPDPATDPAEKVPVPPNEPPGDGPMRWVADYGEAEAAGMAVTVTDADLPAGRSLRTGLDRLVVVGVDWTTEPQAAAGRLAGLLDAHRFSDGLSFVSPGTATNNTGTERSGASTSRTATAAELDPDAAPASLTPDSAARRLARALGLPTASLDALPRAGLLEARTASLLQQVLWSATLGHYLDELFAPVLGDDDVGLARDHVGRWLLPGGPYATLRIGKQPYGVLPVLAPGRFAPDRPGGFEEKLARVLRDIRWLWTDAARRVPRMGRTGDPDTDLHELLQRNPLAMVARFRTVLGPAAVANTHGMDAHAAAQAWSWRMWAAVLGLPEPPALAAYTADPKDHPLPVPWVQAGPLGDGPLNPNYLTSVSAAARTRGGRRALEAQENAETLLHTLVAHAALEELDRAASNLLLTRIGRSPALLAATRTLRTDEMYGVLPEAAAPQFTTERIESRGVTVSTPRQLANLVLPETTGTLTIAEHVADLVRLTRLPERPEVHTLATILAALDELAGRPAVEIDRAFRGFLDTASHRYDAWATSLATRRLDEVRRTHSSGVHLGGFGWVEELRPDTAPDSLGYVHAPSVPHAATAAILRSGHLSHRDTEHETLDIRLSSDRVKRAMPVIEGAAAGRPVTALLGYRCERLLRESADRLARYILPARRFAPLRPPPAPVGPGPQEAIAAHDVVDGVRLLQAWRDNRTAVLAGMKVAPADRQAVSAVFDDLAVTWDAVGDVLVSESVYQTVLGNPERAGAALAALDKQERPPEPEVVRTPRSGTGYTQKVVAAVDHEVAREAWRPLRDARAEAAPMLNAWAAHLLPDPGAFRFWGVLTSPAGNGGPPTRTPLSVTGTDVGLSALSLVLASAGGTAAGIGELDSRVAQALAAGVTVGEDDELALLEDRPDGVPAPAGNEVNLGAARALLGWLRELLAGCRPLTAEDLALPGGDRSTGTDLPDLAARADAAAAAVSRAATALTDALTDAASTAPALRAALRQAAALGIADAVPGAAAGGAAAVRAALRAQAEGIAGEVTQRRDRIDALGAAPPPGEDGTPPPEAAHVAHHGLRLKAAFGETFPVVPRIRPAAPPVDVPGLTASLADRPALTAADDTAARAWLDRLALVRPGVDKLSRALSGAELLGAPGAGADAVLVAQLPHAAGQRWLALPFDSGRPAEAATAWAVHAPGGLDFGRALCGVVCDEWTEVIPAETETTGITFHYDAPGARPPQTLLLAVPPQPAMAHWDLDTLLDTVLEAAALTRIRGVAPADLRLAGAQLPMVHLPQNFTRDRPSVDLGNLLSAHTATITNATVLGKGWSL
ncbi:hypothetical protein ABZ543_27045 [Streptomyces roseifaciens]